MQNSLCHGRHSEDSTPTPLLTFSTVWAEGKYWCPDFGDRHSLLLLKRTMPRQVSFVRAYRGFRASGAREEKELGQGRAFLRWLIKHQISIAWEERDFFVHPYFASQNSPEHGPDDEMGKDLSFAIRPVRVMNRNVKLYLQDADMLSVLNMPYGEEEDFLELVVKYVHQRFQWEKWRAPAPPFLDWMTSMGKRPVFGPGQLGFRPLRKLRNVPGPSLPGTFLKRRASP